jgi:hypothetical protein
VQTPIKWTAFRHSEALKWVLYLAIHAPLTSVLGRIESNTISSNSKIKVKSISNTVKLREEEEEEEAEDVVVL